MPARAPAATAAGPARSIPSRHVEAGEIKGGYESQERDRQQAPGAPEPAAAPSENPGIGESEHRDSANGLKQSARELRPDVQDWDKGIRQGDAVGPYVDEQEQRPAKRQQQAALVHGEGRVEPGGEAAAGLGRTTDAGAPPGRLGIEERRRGARHAI